MVRERPRRTRAPPAHLAESSSDDDSPAPPLVTTRSSRSLRRSRSVSLSADGFASGGEGSSLQPGPSRKRARSSTVDSMDIVQSSEAFAYYMDLVDRLLAQPQSYGFRLPVLDLWEENAVPGYREIITHPMDLGTVKRNLKETRKFIRHGRDGPYLDEDAVLADIRLVFNNCLEYNSPESEFYELAEFLLHLTNEKVAPREKELRKQARKKEELALERKRQRDRDRRARQKAEREEEAEREAELERRRERKRQREAQRRAMIKAAKQREKELHLQRQLEEKKHRDAEAARTAAQRQAQGIREEQRKLMVEQRSKQLIMQETQRRAVEAAAMNSSSVSYDEGEDEEDDEEQNGHPEVRFTFVSTAGLEKKRGRKSAAVMELEAEHDRLMCQRRDLVEAQMDLDKRKSIAMTHEEKVELCDAIQVLDFVRMKAVVDIIAKGMKREELRNEVIVDIPIGRIDNDVLREIQMYLENPAVCVAKDSLYQIDLELTDIESKLIGMRYSKPAGPADRRR